MTRSQAWLFFATILAAPMMCAGTAAADEDKAALSAAPPDGPATETSASPSSRVEDAPTVLVFDLEADVSERKLATTIAGLITTTIAEKSSAEVLSGQDIRRAMQLTAERQAVGCSDDTSCLAEIADAMGAKYVVFGDVGKLGTSYIVQLSVLHSERGQVVSRQAVRADTAEALIEQVPAGTASLMNPILEAEGLPKMEALELKDLSSKGNAGTPLNLPAVITAGGGAAVGALGVVGALVSSIPYGLYAFYTMQLDSLEKGVEGPVTRNTLEAAQELQGQRALYIDVHDRWGLYGIIGSSVVATAGVAALAGGVVWMLLPAPSEEAPAE